MLLQKGLACGPQRSDEEAYRIAKELQFLQPINFGNIYLRIGGFHLEVIIACCGKVGNKIYGINTVNSVMSGSHYFLCKRGMSLIAEALGHLQLSTFFELAELDRYETLFDTITEM